MTDENRWIALTKENPDHSAWYIQRFRTMEAEGADLGGEARFINAISGPQARVLDAGCGTGRVGALLADLGHDVVGVDLDHELIAAAKQASPGPAWFQGDLADLDLPANGVDETFDVIFSAGNVVTFLAPSTRQTVLAKLRDHLSEDGRIIIGFGANRDYEFQEFFADCAAAGLQVDVNLSTWDLRPFTTSSDFLVSVLSTAR